MSYEIGQLDIPDRELLPAGARPRGSVSTEIGEAIVIHTIFGRAKVRIIRKHDDGRRTLWLTVMVVAVAVAAAAWLEWIASRQAGTLRGADAAPHMSASVQDVPLVQPENIPAPAVVPPTANKPAVAAPAGIGSPALRQQVAPQAAQGPDAAAPIPAGPARRPKPSAASTPPDANNTAPMNQADRPRLSTGASAKQTAAAMSAAAQPAQDSTGAVAAPAAPAIKEDDASTPSSAGAGQAADPAAQP